MNCQSHLLRGQHPGVVNRRWFLQQCGVGLGSIALGSLLRQSGFAAPTAVNPLSPRGPHFTPKAKNVIFLFMAGAPSHLELFDNKPELAKWDGKLPPKELLEGYRSAFINPESKLLGPKFKFA
ncbi:MAG TPA: sulfatase, partial [Verrucomicrobiales bacterium]|nr:sulfatase [Verrucomicrobiales bacterium]